MKNTKILMWFCLLFFLSCDKSIKSENPNNYVEPTTPLILISVDGFRWDYFDKVETPNFDRIINNGIKAEGLKTVYPSKILNLFQVYLVYKPWQNNHPHQLYLNLTFLLLNKVFPMVTKFSHLIYYLLDQ